MKNIEFRTATSAQGGLVVMSDDGGANWTVLARWRSSVATRALAMKSRCLMLRVSPRTSRA